MQYPEGYFYICTDAGVLFEGPLPYSIFPIEYEGHDEIPTTPRHRSPIKQLRPYQIEINRIFSKISEHQVSLGDDKLITQSGSKVTAGVVLPGIRGIQVSGMAPTILPGRSGDQYFAFGDGQIAEMYSVAMIPEELEEKGQQDAWASLWSSVKHKKKFVLDAEKFEMFLVRVCSLYLDLAKNYFDENMLIPMVGKSEMVNITEFKNTQQQSYQIRVEASSEDLESVMGRQLMANHILQFASGQMDKEDIGKIIRSMPLASNEDYYKDLTLEYDKSTNQILALDRGEQVLPNKYDSEPYMVKRLTARMSQSDFLQLDPQIQQNYENLVGLYQQQEAEKAKQQQAMQADFIPTEGAQIKVAWYIKDPTNPSRSVQATLPASSINWLVERLSEQGASQEQLMMNGAGAHGVIQKYNELGAGGQPQEQQQPAAQAPTESANQALLAKLQGVL
jgi:hypothetical protein